MAETVNEVIIDVEVNAGNAAQKLADVKNSIADLKDEQAAMNKQVKAGEPLTAAQARLYAENAVKLKDLTAQEKMYTAQLGAGNKEQQEYGKSLAALGAELAQMKNAYRNMTQAQREGAEGQQLLLQIQSLDEQMKSADATMGDYFRSVGHYENALKGLGGQSMQIAMMFQGGFKQALSAAGAAVKGFAKTLMLNPVIMAVAVVVGVLKKAIDGIRDAFKRSDDAGTALQVAFSRLQPIITVLRKGFELLATGVAKVIGGLTKAASAVLGLIPAYKQASQAAEELVIAQDKLEDREREVSKEQAKRNLEIAKLNKEARGNEKLTAKEKEDIYKQIDAMELQSMKENVEIATKRYNQIVKENAQKRKLSDEDKNRETEYYNAMLEAQTNYYDQTTRNASRQAAAREQDAREREAERQQRIAAANAAVQARKEAADKEIEAMRRVNEIAITFIKDESARARAELVNRHKVEIEDLKKRLDEEKNLTTEARTAIQAQIILLERKFAQDLDALDEENLKKRLEKETEIREQYIDERINAIKDETEREVAASNEGYQRRIDALVERLNTEKDLTEQAQKDINDTITLLYEQQVAKEAEIRKNAAEESLKQIFEETTLKAENVMNEALLKAGENGTEAAQIQLDYAQSFLQRLQKMNEETYLAMYGSADAYKQAVLEAQKQVADAQKSQLEAVQQQATDTAATLHAVTGAMSDLFGAVAEDTEEYEKFRKAIAIVDATISLGEAIAKATSISMEGDSYTVALRIAANVAAVVAAFAQVMSTIRSASIPSAGSFASGGIVDGETGATDALTANVTRGEMILTKQDQLRLLDLIRAGVPSTVYDYKAMAEAMGEALKNMPAPVLDYAQFVSFQRRAASTERMVTIK